ncbi:MAG: hypothetical protein AB7V27_09825 [Candidatus Binatia bacterium]
MPHRTDKALLRQMISCLTAEPLDPLDLDRAVEEAAAMLDGLRAIDGLDLTEVEPLITLDMPDTDT